jgi:hypothetical protein
VIWLVQEVAVKAKASAQKPTGYGYTPEEPIRVGGGAGGELAYLQRLRGPKGEQLRYKRRGSRSGPPPVGGMLDLYEVTYPGLEKPVTLYLDMYNHQEPRAPAGFRLD